MTNSSKTFATTLIASLVLVLFPLIVNTPATAATGVLPVTLDSKGWIHFTNIQAYSLGLTNPVNSTLSGKLGADGTCVITSPRYLGSSSENGYSEETAFNPSTCQETIVSGGLTPSGIAIVNNKATLSPSHFPASPGSLGTLSIASAATTAYADFEKISWVDPLDITINSLVSNINWSSNGTSITSRSATPISYNFWLDSWFSSAIAVNLSGDPSYIAAGFGQTFTNTDFEHYVLSWMGPSGYVACNFDSSPAVFYLAPFSEGLANGQFYYSYSNSKHGGCTNLVHFRENHGPGFSS